MNDTSNTQYQRLINTSTFDANNIGMIGIPTRDRPNLLKRLLDSITIEHLENFNGSLVVIDSSTEYAHQCREAVDTARLRLNCPVLYRRPHDTERMIAGITTHVDIDADTLRICLGGQRGFFSAGAARNELLLLQGGTSAIQFDDDIILNYKRASDYDDQKLRLTSEVPLQVKTFLTHEDIGGGLHAIAGNPISMYEDFFRTLKSNSREIVHDASTTLEHRIQQRDAHLLYIQNGLYGDSCVQRFFSVQQSPEKNKNLYVASEAEYHVLKQSTHVIQSVESPIVTDHLLCIAAYIAISGEKISPPFPPIGRGEDFLAGVLARQCCVGSFSLHLGTLVEHGRDEVIPVPKISALALPPSNRILAGIIGQNSYRGTTEENLRDAGLLLRSISDTDLDTFKNYLIRQSRQVWKASAERLDEKMHTYQYLPEHWKSDMKSHIQELETSQGSTDAEIANRVGEDYVWGGIQRGYLAYGKLLQKWPDLWKVSIDNRENML